jgi:hypothetical protein
VSTITSKQNYHHPAGVGTSDGGPNEATIAVDKGALLGLKFTMAASTAFEKTFTARPTETSSPQKDLLMIGEEGKYKMTDIPWGESGVDKPFPTGWALRGMEVGMTQNTAGH